jgi:hypothetical protein
MHQQCTSNCPAGALVARKTKAASKKHKRGQLLHHHLKSLGNCRQPRCQQDGYKQHGMYMIIWYIAMN